MAQTWNDTSLPWQTWDGTNHPWKNPALVSNDPTLPWKDGAATIGGGLTTRLLLHNGIDYMLLHNGTDHLTLHTAVVGGINYTGTNVSQGIF